MSKFERALLSSCWDREMALSVVERWHESGKSLKDFCAEYGLRTQRVSNWLKKLDVSEAKASEPSFGFYPVHLVGTEVVVDSPVQSEEDLVIELGAELLIRVPASWQQWSALGELVRGLSQSC